MKTFDLRASQNVLFSLKAFISVQSNSNKVTVFAVTEADSKSVASGQTNLWAEAGTLESKQAHAKTDNKVVLQLKNDWIIYQTEIWRSISSIVMTEPL